MFPSSKCFYTAFGLMGIRRRSGVGNHPTGTMGRCQDASTHENFHKDRGNSCFWLISMFHYFATILYFVPQGMLVHMVTYTIGSFSHCPLGPPRGCSTHMYGLCICRYTYVCMQLKTISQECLSPDILRLGLSQTWSLPSRVG